jgi:hypothetical protein
MGVTIESKNYSEDLGYGGFSRFRDRVASLSNPVFGKHYAKLNDTMFLMGTEREAYFKEYDAETERLIKANVITAEIANFCYQSDCDGSINQEQARQIYEKIKDYDDKVCYGYSGRSDCAMFSNLKAIFKDCAENGGTIDWS